MTSIFISLASFGIKSKSQPLSGLFKLIVGGEILLTIDKIENIDSTAPAAPKVCPVIDLVELIGGGESKIDLTALHSARSPRGVDVA